MGKRYLVRLTRDEAARLEVLAGDGTAARRLKQRARALLLAHEGRSDEEVALALLTSVATVQRTRKRFAEGGLDAALGGHAACPYQAALARGLEIEGAIGVALIDGDSGTCLAKGGAGLDLDVAAAGNAEVVRAKAKTIGLLDLGDSIEDILISLSTQYHVIRPLSSSQSLFLYIALDRRRANLALARHKLEEIEKGLSGPPSKRSQAP